MRTHRTYVYPLCKCTHAARLLDHHNRVYYIHIYSMAAAWYIVACAATNKIFLRSYSPTIPAGAANAAIAVPTRMLNSH